MKNHIIALEHGETVTSKSMFFRTELYSEKHHAKLTTEVTIEINWADSMLERLKLILNSFLSIVIDCASLWMMLMIEGKMMYPAKIQGCKIQNISTSILKSPYLVPSAQIQLQC